MVGRGRCLGGSRIEKQNQGSVLKEEGDRTSKGFKVQGPDGRVLSSASYRDRLCEPVFYIRFLPFRNSKD